MGTRGAGVLLCAHAAAAQPLPAADAPPPLVLAREALESGRLDDCLRQVDRALERDPGSPAAWDLRARWAEAAGNRDERVRSLHRRLSAVREVGAPKEEIRAVRDLVLEADPVAGDLFALPERFVGKLASLAAACEKDGRPHAAVRLHRQILGLDPDRAESLEAIDRISRRPDPSLADSARPLDLLADVPKEWIEEYDAKHATWDTRAELKGEHYTTKTDAGYEVLVRCAEAMDQMNAFYRVFFDCRDKSIARIDLNIFRSREEYLEKGIGPPVKWSAGHFTGGAVETYVGEAGFSGSVGTLFHEAAHQFVAATTNASGWLNEGLASFFEGCRILPNGSVLMNEPADHRLFPLAARMQAGWMKDADDGIDPENPSAGRPTKAPTFRIVLENRYDWGPPWYAPTWGVVYFLYNRQDPVDGRYLHREAFRKFANASGGRSGKGAVKNFEEMVLAHPSRPTPGIAAPAGTAPAVLPRTVEELDPVWKEWILRLRDERSGRLEVDRPWLRWAACAVRRGEGEVATEQFERALREAPGDPAVLEAFADHLAGRLGRNPDRAARLYIAALRILEDAAEPDAGRIAALENSLEKADPDHRAVSRLLEELGARCRAVVDRYMEEGLLLQAMETSGRFDRDLRIPGMAERLEAAIRRAGRSPAIWSLAYNERDLAGWTGGGGCFHPAGDEIAAEFGEYRPGRYDYQSLSLDRVTSGDFSLEAEVFLQGGAGAFAGLLFGMKSPTAYHALILFPALSAERAPDGTARKAYLDLTSFYDVGVYETLRHDSLGDAADGWHRLRLDVAGNQVDVWFDGGLVTTQAFPGREVLRGSFGLFTGVGSSRFRNVRYLARDPRDPAARIEREIRLEKALSSETPVNGSWLGRRPPSPGVVRWLRGPRTSWEEKGPVPTLLVFWSVKQDGLVPLNDWLTWLAAGHADVGLEVVSISQPDDPGKVEAWLAEHPFPGSVGVDVHATRESRFGTTLERFFVGSKNNLPHLVLIDVDGRVAWEGSPGFEMGKPWKEGDRSYLDEALDDLVRRGMLREAAAWRTAWEGKGRAAVAAGDYAALRPLLVDAQALPPRLHRAAGRAAEAADRLSRALDDFDGTAASLDADGRAPAVKVLSDWAKESKRPLDFRRFPAARPVLSANHPAQAAWRKALEEARAGIARLEGGNAAEGAAAVAGALESLEGAFPAELAAAVREAAAGGDAEAVKGLLREAPSLPARWLLGEWLGLQ